MSNTAGQCHKCMATGRCTRACACTRAHTHTHTHTHPFSGPLSTTTRVSRYQKGKTNLDFDEARDSEWQWHQLGHMQVCTLLHTESMCLWCAKPTAWQCITNDHRHSRHKKQLFDYCMIKVICPFSSYTLRKTKNSVTNNSAYQFSVELKVPVTPRPLSCNCCQVLQNESNQINTLKTASLWHKIERMSKITVQTWCNMAKT